MILSPKEREANHSAAVLQMTSADVLATLFLAERGRFGWLRPMQREMQDRVDFRAMLARQRSAERIRLEFLQGVTPADCVREELAADAAVRDGDVAMVEALERVRP